MIELRGLGEEFKLLSLYSLDNLPIVNSSHTDHRANGEFSLGAASGATSRLGNCTARVRLVPLDVSVSQATPQVDLPSIDKGELQFIRRQLLQGLESSNKSGLLEVLKSKCSVPTSFLTLGRRHEGSHF